MFSKKIKPVFVSNKNLIRIGPKRDGGYVIDKRIIKTIDHIITCGLSDDWNFEKDFLKINNNVKVTAYDHTVNKSFWVNRFFKDILHLFLLKKLSIWKIVNIFRYIDYLFFFKNGNKHHEIKIGKNNIKNKEHNLDIILKNKKNILLKIDIEGAEYQILNQILRNNAKINCLIIEFHEIKKNMRKIINFVEKNKNLKLIHIHANNVSGIDKYGFPYAIEITFVNSKKIKYMKNKNIKNYPIKGLDYPSVKRRVDIPIIFK